ncbi:MAG: element excision factor XisI family protein [Bacteroidota bacterium]
MDRTKEYQKAIIDFLSTQGSYQIYGKPKVKSRVILDTDNHQYLLVWTGWHEHKYIHRLWYHFEIIDGRIWVLHNATDVEVDKELIALGVPKEAIIGAFVPDYLRDAA